MTQIEDDLREYKQFKYSLILRNLPTMRFAQSLTSLMIPEWRQCYVDYRTLKIYVNLIKQLVVLLEIIDKFLKKKTKGNDNDKDKDKDKSKKHKNKEKGPDNKDSILNAQQQMKNFQQPSLQNINNVQNLVSYSDTLVSGDTKEEKLTQLKEQLVYIMDRLHKNFSQLLYNQIQLSELFTHMKYIQLKEKLQYYIWLSTQYDFLLSQEDQKVNQTYCTLIQYVFIENNYLIKMFTVVKEGERKILKKHKKIVKGRSSTPDGKHPKLNRLDFNSNRLQHQIQDFYILAASARSKTAREYIRSIAQPNEIHHTDSFFFGLWVGTGLTVLAFIIAIIGINQFSLESASTREGTIFNRDFAVWRGLAFFIIYIWVLSLNIYGYEKYFINHRLIFKFDDHHASTSTDMFRLAGVFTTIFLILFLIYILELTHVVDWDRNFPSYYLMLFGWGSLIVYVLAPFPIFNHNGRLYFARLAYWSVFAPFLGVIYPVIWMTDQLVSLATPISDFVYGVCFYTQLDLTNPYSHNQCLLESRAVVTLVVGAIAYSYRILQCFRQGYDSDGYFNTRPFYNTIKYTLSLGTVVIAYIYKNSPDLFPLWLVSAAFSTIYSYIWDLKVDWGLLQMKSRYKFLRNDLFYPVQFYYSMIVLNLAFRLIWILTLSPNIIALFGNAQLFTLLTGALEIFRRGLWNMMRTETQQIKNCGKFKALPEMKQIEDQLIKKCLLQQGKNPQTSVRVILKPGQDKAPLYTIQAIRSLKDEFRRLIDDKIDQKNRRVGEIQKENKITMEDLEVIRTKFEAISGEKIERD